MAKKLNLKGRVAELESQFKENAWELEQMKAKKVKIESAIELRRQEMIKLAGALEEVQKIIKEGLTNGRNGQD